MNLEAIAITDHVRNETTWFKDFAENVAFEAKKFNVATFIGCETKVINIYGHLDINDETVASSDIVLASVHRLPFMKDANFKEIEPELLGETEFELSLAVLSNPLVDVLAHPLGMTMRWTNKFNTKKFSEIVEEALKNDVAVEINTNYMRGENLKLVLGVLSDLNPFVSVGSDAHTLDRIGDVKIFD